MQWHENPRAVCKSHFQRVFHTGFPGHPADNPKIVEFSPHSHKHVSRCAPCLVSLRMHYTAEVRSGAKHQGAGCPVHRLRHTHTHTQTNVAVRHCGEIWEVPTLRSRSCGISSCSSLTETPKTADRDVQGRKCIEQDPQRFESSAMSMGKTVPDFPPPPHIRPVHLDIIKVLFIHQLMNYWDVLEAILKFTLKQLRHVSVFIRERIDLFLLKYIYMQPHHHRINHTPMYFNGLF